MNTRLRSAVAVVSFLALAVPAAAQDTLARAKDIYKAAAYEEALDLLKRIHGSAKPNEATEIAVYQIFCLLALGRNDEAKVAIQTVVRADPLYRLPEEAASPRVRATFDEVRRPMLPDIVKRLYLKAKAAFDEKDFPTAAADFDRLIALLDETDIAETEGVADMRTLAAGFRDLSRPVTPPEPPAGSNVPGGRPIPVALRTYGPEDTDVKPPVPVTQTMPAWRPGTPGDAHRDFRGALELLIDQNGAISSAILRESVHPDYDRALLEAVKKWRFKPATVYGSPVTYRHIIQINLRGSRGGKK